MLGSVTAQFSVNAKGIISASANQKVDLRDPKVQIAGCSGINSAEDTEPRMKSKSRLAVGEEVHR